MPCVMKNINRWMSPLSTILPSPTCFLVSASPTGNISIITFLVMTKSKYNLNIFRHGFTVVFTAWRHADGPEGCGKKGFFFLNKMSFFVLDGHLDRAQGVKYQKVRGMAVWDLGYLVYFRVIISLLVLFLLIEYKKEYLNLIVIQVAKINWSAWW